MIILRQGASSTEIALGPFVDSLDGVTPETSLTISQADVRLKKNGGDWAQKNESTSAAHEENGWYRVLLNGTDLDTMGVLKIAVYESGALPVHLDVMVVKDIVYDGLFTADALVPVDISRIDADGDAASQLVTLVQNNAFGELDVRNVEGSLSANSVNASALAPDALAEITAATFTSTDRTTLNSISSGGATPASVWAYSSRTLTSGVIQVVRPWQTGELTIIKGNSYLDADNTEIIITKSDTATWPSNLFSAGDYTITFTCTPTQRTTNDVSGAVGFTTTTGAVLSATQVRLGDMSASTTNGLTIPLSNGANAYTYEVKASRSSDTIVHTLERGTMSVG